MAGKGLKLAQDAFKLLITSKGFDRVMDKAWVKLSPLHMFTLAAGPTQLPIQCVLGFRWLEHGVGHSSPPDTEVHIVSGGDGHCRAELVVAPEHQNRMGTLHGGLTATLVDTISTVALLTHKVGVPGVTVDLHVSYMKAAAEGETVVIDCSTLKAGRTLAFLSVEIMKKETGEIIAVGSHTKFIGS